MTQEFKGTTGTAPSTTMTKTWSPRKSFLSWWAGPQSPGMKNVGPWLVDLAGVKHCTSLLWTSQKHKRGNTPLLSTGCSTQRPRDPLHTWLLSIALECSSGWSSLLLFSLFYCLIEKTTEYKKYKTKNCPYCPNTSVSHFTQSSSLCASPSVHGWQQCSFSSPR